MLPNASYTGADHRFRSKDAYAGAKYELTNRWLAHRLRPGTTLANIGCGSGEYNAWVRKRGVRVVGCEPDAAAFALAYELAKDDADCSLECCGLTELAEKTAPVDLLVMHDVLEHIEDEAEAVAAIGRLVRPGGEAVISVPAYQWLFGSHDRMLGHYRRYTLPRLKALFAKDFEVAHARYFGSLFIPVTLWFSRIRQSGYPTAAASQGIGHRLMSAACAFQRALPEPFGTSALVHLRRSHSTHSESVDPQKSGSADRSNKILQ
jgi:2-polyprenyl-3-methyl-5-hydroxy-6-metoxy-1,4-benzoquinol methylase